MPSPFPGMNPYLESPAVWSSFHTRLLVAIADTLAPVLRPNYYIVVETRTYKEQEEEDDELLVGIPDAAVLSATLQEPIPSFPLLLRPEDEEPMVDLQAIVQGVCKRAGYNERLDYRQSVPPPALSEADQQWMETLLAPL